VALPPGRLHVRRPRRRGRLHGPGNSAVRMPVLTRTQVSRIGVLRVVDLARSWLVLCVLLMGGVHIGKAAPEARLMVGEPVIAMRESRACTVRRAAAPDLRCSSLGLGGETAAFTNQGPPRRLIRPTPRFRSGPAAPRSSRADLVAGAATMGKRPQPAMRVPRSFPRGSQARLESAGRDSCSPWMPEADGGSSALSELVQGGRRGSDL
jgi:hypothetical protein